MLVSRKLYLTIFLLLSVNVFSQSFVATQSNYSGSRSLLMNPALMSSSYIDSDVSIANVGLSLYNDFVYFKGIDIQRLVFSENHPAPHYTIDGKNYDILIYDNQALKPYNIYETIDLNLLSLMFTLDEKQNVGFFVNGRVYTNGVKIPYEIPEILAYGLDDGDYYGNYSSSGAKIATMEWAEIAMAYSRNVYERYLNMVDVGISLKYLMGYSAAAVNFNNMDYDIFQNDSIEVNKFDSDIAYSIPIKYDEPFSSNSFFDNTIVRGNGLALDLGFTFIRKKNFVYNKPRIIEKCMRPKIDYKWKLAVSMMDVGFINFNNNAQVHKFYSENAIHFDKSIFDNVESFGNLTEYLSGVYYEGDSTASYIGDKFKMGLPTTFRVQFDYNIVKHLYLNATFIQPVNLFKYSVRAMPQMFIEPRFESRYFDLSIPVGIRNYKHLVMGASVRVAFITVGTQNLSYFLGYGDVNGLDLYVSLKFNIPKGRCSGDRYDACWSAGYENYKNRKRQ